MMNFLSGGLWIIPAICLIGASIFFVKAVKANKSGAYRYDYYLDKDGIQRRKYVDLGHRPLYQEPQSWFAAALLVAAVVITIAMYFEQ